MKARAHLVFADFLLEKSTFFTGKISRMAFKFGNIQPDINFLTYFRKCFVEERMRGHNYENCVHHMEKLSEKIDNAFHFGISNAYTLGKLTHYLADSFTLAHNNFFGGDLVEHRRYEMKLIVKFIEELEYKRHEFFTPMSFKSILHGFREEYENGVHGVENDCKYIIEACSCLLAYCGILAGVEHDGERVLVG